MKFIKAIVIMLLTLSLLVGCNPDGNQELSVADTQTLGEGATQFQISVIYDGVETPYIINTDKATVGEALMELGLISGDMGDYGLYVKTVNGVTLDYATDGMYWAFYVNGSYAMSGVDTTPIAEGETYAFKAEK